MRPTILAFTNWFLPGNKGGGSVSAIVNLIELLGDEFRFHVITRDRDLAEKSAYEGLQMDHWITVGKARVLYTGDLSFANLRRHVLNVDPDVIYLNSFFSPMTRKILFLRRAGLLKDSAVILAPQGELSPGSLSLKPLRKWLYRNTAIRAGICRGVTWQASSELESRHITAATKGEIPAAAQLILTPNAPRPDLLRFPLESRQPEKRLGKLRLIFLSRIARTKNLHFALEAVAAARGDIQFEIVGPAEDPKYWGECQKRARNLPANIVVRNAGPVGREDVNRALLQHHFLLLPTLGENFGYVIIEALAVGCPVIISDQTPWRGLRAAGVGWDLPLGRLDLWRNTLQECVDMHDEEYQRMSRRAREFAENWYGSSLFLRDGTNLFRSALQYAAS
jgi:glycosyltransferase involved in cell wall biosynthesis